MLKASRIYKDNVKTETPFKTWIEVEKEYYNQLRQEGYSFDNFLNARYRINGELAWVKADANGNPTTELRDENRSILESITNVVKETATSVKEIVTGTKDVVAEQLVPVNNKILGMNKRFFYIAVGIGVTYGAIKIYKYYNKK